jgi:hypothetical protein
MLQAGLAPRRDSDPRATGISFESMKRLAVYCGSSMGTDPRSPILRGRSA